MAPNEALYGHKCHSLLYYTKLGERQILGPELFSETEDNVRLIWDRLKAPPDR